MLYVALVAAGLVLLMVNIAANRPKKRVVGTAIFAFLGSLSTIFMCFILPPVIWQSLMLIVVGIVWKYGSNQKPSRYLAFSLAATAIAFAIPMLNAIPRHRELAEFRKEFPLESLEARLPSRTGTPLRSTDRFSDLEELEISIGRVDYAIWHRQGQLRNLHERSVDAFVQSAGFGVGRMVRTEPTNRGLRHGLFEGPAPLQPADADPSSVSPPGPLPAFPSLDAMKPTHHAGVLDFVHAAGFGYFKNPQQVAGFQSHGFKEVPPSQGDWNVGRLELVSLLKHEQPKVYVTARLPRMEDLKGVPVRDLDEFEATALESLKAGSDLIVKESRMLGSVRATKQCLECHGGNRGDLLGAFTYTLRPAGK